MFPSCPAQTGRDLMDRGFSCSRLFLEGKLFPGIFVSRFSSPAVPSEPFSSPQLVTPLSSSHGPTTEGLFFPLFRPYSLFECSLVQVRTQRSHESEVQFFFSVGLPRLIARSASSQSIVDIRVPFLLFPPPPVSARLFPRSFFRAPTLFRRARAGQQR